MPWRLSRKKGLYRVIILTAKTYTEALLKAKSAPNGQPYSL